MNWDNTRYFLAIARTGSLRKAAASLHVDQATVARRLRTLEKELNINLVDRQPEGYRLTNVGQQLVIDIEQMEAAAARLVRRSRGINNAIGTIHIAATESIAHCFVLPAISKLKANTPDIHIHLDSSPIPVDIRRGDTDIAIRNLRPSDPNMVIRRLATFELGLYASKDYLHKRGIPVPGNALAKHDLIMYPQKALPQYWQQLCGQAITNANVVLETQSQWNYITALKQGLGIGMMARQIVDKCCPELVHISSLGHESTDIWLVVNPEVWPSENIQAVVSAIAAEFGK